MKDIAMIANHNDCWVRGIYRLEILKDLGVVKNAFGLHKIFGVSDRPSRIRLYDATEAYML